MKNFGIVVPELLFRSGKYTAYQLEEIVKKYNIKQVIDLRNRAPLLTLSTYKKIGVIFRQVPINEHEAFPRNALSIWDQKTITLIHCWKGAHRTGAWVALFRLTQGWSFNDAIKEMMDYGFGNPEEHKNLYESITL